MGLYRTTIHGSQSGQTVEVIQGWMNSTVTNSSDALALATAVGNYWGSVIMPLVADDYAITGVTAIGMDNTTVGAFQAHSTSGGSTADPIPLFIVANVHLTTALRGRSYVGRYGIPGLVKTYLDTTNGNLMTSAAQSALQTAVGTYRSDVSAILGGTPMAVISTTSGGTPRVPPIGTPVTSQTVQLALGSRVSRKG